MTIKLPSREELLAMKLPAVELGLWSRLGKRVLGPVTYRFADQVAAREFGAAAVAAMTA